MAVRKRFTPEARDIVIAATNAAAIVGAEQIEAEHFLIALLVGPPSAAQNYLRQSGLSRADVELAIADTQQDVDFDDQDVAALAALGFDLPQILQQLEERFGPTPAPPSARRGPRKLRVGFGESAKQLLQQAFIEASFRKQGVSPEYILLGLLRDPSQTCADLAEAHSLSYEDACTHMFAPPQSNAC